MDRRVQRVRSLMDDVSLEVTPQAALRTPDALAVVRPGTTITITHLPGSDWRDIVRVAVRLRRAGLEPAPHLAARSIRDRRELERYVGRVVDEAGARHMIVIAGSAPEVSGEYHDSMQILATGVLERHGIERIGVAGHPEGNPEAPRGAARSALAWKAGYAERSRALFYICTQFVFEADPLVAWLRALRRDGIQLPVRVGVAGPATVKTLLRYAALCGIGPSVRFLRRQRDRARSLVVSPDRVLRQLAASAPVAELGIDGVHVYPFGGLERSARWAYAIADGKFETDAHGGLRVHPTG